VSINLSLALTGGLIFGAMMRMGGDALETGAGNIEGGRELFEYVSKSQPLSSYCRRRAKIGCVPTVMIVVRR
jgi:hypothetical protein